MIKKYKPLNFHPLMAILNIGAIKNKTFHTSIEREGEEDGKV